MENPTEANRTGRGGGGSSSGLTTNQAATGTRETSQMFGSGLGGGDGGMSASCSSDDKLAIYGHYLEPDPVSHQVSQRQGKRRIWYDSFAIYVARPHQSQLQNPFHLRP